jgi:hypothetical protein
MFPMGKVEFTKRAEGMNFVNAQPDTFPSLSKQDLGGGSETISFPFVPWKSQIT